jgi:arylsulfatase
VNDNVNFQSTGRRPNVVVVMADQHRADVMGCSGDAVVKTPNLDALANSGVRFSHVTCQGPLCMPARASFLTERYVRDHGVYTNWAEVPEGWPTYLHSLQKAGYHTAQVGKAHLVRDDDPENPIADVKELADRMKERGFTEVIETGDKFTTNINTPYIERLKEVGLYDLYRQHIADRSYQGDNESGANPTKTVPMWDATPSPLPLSDYIDTWHGDLAVNWVESYDKDQPFFLFVGFPGPHDPWDAPVEAVDEYRDIEPTMPRSTKRPDLEGLGSYGKLLGGMLSMSDTGTMDAAAIAGMRRAYFANVTVIDRAVGRIVDALEAKGVLDNTWIMYTSDHGEMGGDHGLMSKCLMYEQATRVPLIVRPPGGMEARVVDDLVEAIDIPATVRAIADAPDVPGAQSRSLLGYLEGDDPTPRDVSISENWGFASFETDRYKLVIDEDLHQPAQLFDLVEDPFEDDNLAASAEHEAVIKELMETYVEPFLAVSPARPHPTPFR